MLAAALVGAIATVILAIGAGFTVYYAKQAFDKQSQEVSTLQKQASDQSEMLRVQSEQLDAQHDQLREQQKLNEKQTEVMELQVRELQASLQQRERDAGERRRAQATRVFVWEERRDHDPRIDQATLSACGQRPQPTIEARVKNASEQPIYNLLIRWHRGSAPWGEGDLLRPLLPGEEANAIRDLPSDLPDSVDRLVFGAVVYFRDAEGNTWRKHPDGRLDEMRDR